MKKLVLFLLLAFVFPAQAQMSKTSIQSLILLSWPDNNSNAITASKLRTPNQTIVNSYLDLNGVTSFQCPATQFMTGFTTLSTPSCAILGSTTGTGSFVLANSPILVTPNLGTPSVLNLNNATGLPISTGVIGLGTGVSTVLATNVGTAGSVIINGGALGTPSSATLTNATGLPLSTGVTGLGSGISTALGTAVGSAGSVVVNGDVLGTPSSGVGTNLTALNASNLGSGTVAAARGGAGTITGALKGNGSGVVSQAACADLSNGGTACAQAYTAGAWTPTITTTGTVGTPTYSSIQVGSYEQIGRQVTARFAIQLTAWSGSPTGVVEISLAGLPTPTTTANDYGTCFIGNYVIAGVASNFGVTGYIQPSTTVVVLETNGQTGSGALSPTISGSTPQFIGTCFYRTN